MQEMESIRPRYHGRLVIDLVVPDYYARRPKACMGGWARRSLNVTPSGPRAAVPRGRNHPRPAVLVGARPSAGRDMARVAGVSGISRHRLDAGAVPLLRHARDRLRRLPLPGDGARPATRRRPIRHANCRRITRACRRSPRQDSAEADRRLRVSRAAPRAARLLPFQLTERRGRVARVVVVEQLPAASLRAADVGHRARERRARRDHGGAYPAPAP